MSDCLFCKMIDEEIPCNKIYESDSVLAFLDINPEDYGHTLIIPKKHSRNILDIKDCDCLLKEISHVANLLHEKLEADGLNLVQNSEEVAGQIIFHTHFHIIPRYKEKKLDKMDFDGIIAKINN